MNEGQAFFAFAILFVVGFMVVMTPVMLLVNRAIGATYDKRAAAIAPYLQSEGLRFSEDGVRMRASWVAPLAVSLRWKNVDVRVTSRALYLVQSARILGMRIGQPILAFPLRGAQLDPFVASNVMTGWLGTIRTDDAAHLTGGLAIQRFTMRIALRDLAGFAAATA